MGVGVVFVCDEEGWRGRGDEECAERSTGSLCHKSLKSENGKRDSQSGQKVIHRSQRSAWLASRTSWEMRTAMQSEAKAESENE